MAVTLNQKCTRYEISVALCEVDWSSV